MNIIKFDIEIKKNILYFSYFSKKSAREIIENCFVKKLEFEGNLKECLKNEWDNIKLPELKALCSHEYLIGYTTTKNIKVFLFEKDNTNLRGKDNVSLEVISFGDLPVEQILNESFIKIKSIVTKLKCEHINDTRIFIFPYDSIKKDIYTYELKIRADLKSRFNIKFSDFIRWGFIFLTITICAILFLKAYSKLLLENPLLRIYLSIIAAGIFYLLCDFITLVLIPLIFKRGHMRVEINNLSSVVETGVDSYNTQSKELNIPES